MGYDARFIFRRTLDVTELRYGPRYRNRLTNLTGCPPNSFLNAATILCANAPFPFRERARSLSDALIAGTRTPRRRASSRAQFPVVPPSTYRKRDGRCAVGS